MKQSSMKQRTMNHSHIEINGSNAAGSKLSVYQICLVALAAGINVAGGQLALLLRLPIYLDSIGTILIGAVLGPFYGILPNLLSGVIMGMTTDIYSLYFAPVGMITGMMAGLILGRDSMRKDIFGKQKGNVTQSFWILPAALFVSIPGTAASSLICSLLFGGVTSSGSAVLVQLLAKTPLGMTASIFIVQVLTDYLDRAVSIFLVCSLLRTVPRSLLAKWKGAQ